MSDYEAKLKDQLIELRELMRGAVGGELALVADLHMLAHRIHGTAGVMGYLRESEFAQRVELAAALCLEAPERATSSLEDLANNFDWQQEPKSSRPQFATASARSVVTESPVVPPKVMVIEDDPDFIIEMQRMGRSNLVEVIPASSLEEAAQLGLENSLQGVVVDYYLGEQLGIDIALKLREMDQFSKVPFAFVSVDDSLETRVACSHAGGVFFLEKPVTDTSFSTLLQRFAALAERVRSRVLLVDDDPDLSRTAAGWLADEGWAVMVEDDPRELLTRCKEWRPELVILDFQMPHLSGLECCRLLRTSMHWANIPIIFLTASIDPKTQATCFEAGADDFVDKPILRQKLVSRVRNRLERQELLKHQAERDMLTGVLNRAAFLQRCDMRLAEAAREGSPVSVCLLDMDNFKQVNNRHGHIAGDDVLRTFGHKLLSRFRIEDLRCRWGGEEFVLLLVGNTVSEAANVLQRFLSEFSHLEFEANDCAFHVTFSSGLAQYPDDGRSLRDLMAVADRRLHRAKRLGKNRIELGDGPDASAGECPVLLLVVHEAKQVERLCQSIRDTHELHVVTDPIEAAQTAQSLQPTLMFVDEAMMESNPQLRQQLRRSAPTSLISPIGKGRISVSQFVKQVNLASARAEQLAQLQDSLSHLRAIKRRILTHVGAAYLVVSTDGEVADANDGARKVFADRDPVGVRLEALFDAQELMLPSLGEAPDEVHERHADVDGLPVRLSFIRGDDEIFRWLVLLEPARHIREA